jgi:hypothetical protein
VTDPAPSTSPSPPVGPGQQATVVATDTAGGADDQDAPVPVDRTDGVPSRLARGVRLGRSGRLLGVTLLLGDQRLDGSSEIQ